MTAAVHAGISVVSDTGDSGTTNTIGSPGSDPKVIDPGATTSSAAVRRRQARASNSPVDASSATTSPRSAPAESPSRAGPDLVAPGDLGWAVCTPNPDLYGRLHGRQRQSGFAEDFGGTSQSTPLTSGASRWSSRLTEHPPWCDSRPALVKRILTSTATDLGHPSYERVPACSTRWVLSRRQCPSHKFGSPKRVGTGLLIDPGQSP